jgi:Tfp pilus assembly protein FimV
VSRVARVLRIAILVLVLPPSVLGARVLGAAEPTNEEPTQTHEVRPGETLWTISAEELGDGALWVAVYRANRDQIKNPKVLHPGQKLAIPTVEPSEREALRREGFRGLPALAPSP